MTAEKRDLRDIFRQGPVDFDIRADRRFDPVTVVDLYERMHPEKWEEWSGLCNHGSKGPIFTKDLVRQFAAMPGKYGESALEDVRDEVAEAVRWVPARVVSCNIDGDILGIRFPVVVDLKNGQVSDVEDSFALNLATGESAELAKFVRVIPGDGKTVIGSLAFVLAFPRKDMDTIYAPVSGEEFVGLPAYYGTSAGEAEKMLTDCTPVARCEITVGDIRRLCIAGEPGNEELIAAVDAYRPDEMVAAAMEEAVHAWDRVGHAIRPGE